MTMLRELPTLSCERPSTSGSPESYPGNHAEGYDLLDLILPVLRKKRRIALSTLAATFIGVAVALAMPPVFTATAVIMSPQQEQSAVSSLMGQLGNLGSLGTVSGIGIKNPADIYVGMLQSRIIADALISRFNLQSVFNKRVRADARRVLREHVSFEAAKDGLIYITAKERDPKLAASLANGFVEELHQMNSRLAVGEAAQRRLFFNEQLADERKELTAAEDDLKVTEEKTGIIQLSGQAEVTIQGIASARADIANREVQLGVMRTFATDRNPDVSRQVQEIASRRNQLAALENDQLHAAPGDFDVPAGRVPAAGLQYLRKLREVRYHESLTELLQKQQVAASLDEARSVPLIQVVDPAEVPERKSGPSRTLIIVGFVVVGFSLSATWAIVADVLGSFFRMPSQAGRFEEACSALWSHRVNCWQ